MYEQEKQRLIMDIEKALLQAYEACRDNIDVTEDLSSVVKRKCQELRYIGREEAQVTRRGDFTKGSCPQYPNVGSKKER